MIRSILLVSSCILLLASIDEHSELNAQTLKYRIDWKGDSIGYILAQKTTHSNEERYSIKTEANISFIFSFTMITDFHTFFDNGILKEASTKSVLNKKQKHFSKVKHLNDAYQIETEDGSFQLSKRVTESIVTMYFKEPLNNEVFSERYGKMCGISKLGHEKYELKKPDGRTNVYYFKNGICQGGQINLSLATFIFQKIN